MAPSAKNSKPIFKTSSPYTDTKWPSVSHDNQEIILDLVCNLLAPLGEYRKTHIQPSRGKKRRRTKDAKSSSEQNEAPPPPSELGKHVLIGINSVTRHLEALVSTHAPGAAKAQLQISFSERKTSVPNDEAREDEPRGGEAPTNAPPQRPLSMVLITHPNPSTSLLHNHLPTLVHLSSLPPDLPSSADRVTRLVPLSSSADARLASTLHIPRVGAIGILENAPGAKALEDYVRETVGITECKWIDEAMRAEWKGLNVRNEATELTIR